MELSDREIIKKLAALDSDVQKSRSFAAVIQGIVVIIIVGVMGWVATEVQNLGKTMIKVQAQLVSVEVQLATNEKILDLQLSGLQEELESEVERNKELVFKNAELLEQIWSRLRAANENATVIINRWNRRFPEDKIPVKTPEKF